MQNIVQVSKLNRDGEEGKYSRTGGGSLIFNSFLCNFNFLCFRLLQYTLDALLSSVVRETEFAVYCPRQLRKSANFKTDNKYFKYYRHCKFEIVMNIISSHKLHRCWYSRFSFHQVIHAFEKMASFGITKDLTSGLWKDFPPTKWESASHAAALSSYFSHSYSGC